MDDARARELIEARRAEVSDLLEGRVSAGREDRAAQADATETDDAAQPLTEEGVDNAVAESLRERLAALDRAEKRLEEGTYGVSIRSGDPIPDARLEADPGAELTVEEAAQDEANA